MTVTVQSIAGGEWMTLAPPVPRADLMTRSDALLGILEELNLAEVEYAPAPVVKVAERLFAQVGSEPTGPTVQHLLDRVFDAQETILSAVRADRALAKAAAAKLYPDQGRRRG